MFDYIDGGADDEVTMHRNRMAFDEYELAPRVLVDVGAIDPRTDVLGHSATLPLILAPTGMSRLFHHEGERAVAKSAARANLTYSLSTMGSCTIEEIGALTPGHKCFQIYPFRDRGLTREFIERCRTAGFNALCLTVDVPIPGNRERDLRSGMTIPPRFSRGSFISFATHLRWAARTATSSRIQFENIVHRSHEDKALTTLAKYIHDQFNPRLSWEDLAELSNQWDGPFAVKGILRSDDARRAVDHGATAVIVSNHGGRQLDGAVASLRALPAVVHEVGAEAEVILDGGIRRGTDVIKALALGARACMIGRAYLYGLAAGGEAGVDHAINTLSAEIHRALALVGARTPADVTPDMVGEVNAAVRPSATGSISGA
jgi:L-lactate dehydrogenase (cytochrome)